MSFAVVLEPEAEAVLVGLIPDVGELVVDAIDELALSPTAVRGIAVPDAGPGLTFASKRKFAGTTYQVQITFQYGQDEQTIHVLNIAVRPI